MKTTSTILFAVAGICTAVAVYGFMTDKDEPIKTESSAQPVVSQQETIDEGLAQNRERAAHSLPFGLEEFAYSEENVRAVCKENAHHYPFGTPEEKYEACLKMQRESYDELVKHASAATLNVPVAWVWDVLPRIWERNTNFRGLTNYGMVNGDFIKQNIAYGIYEDTKASPELDVARMRHCENEWEHHWSRWTMTMHCYDND